MKKVFVTLAMMLAVFSSAYAANVEKEEVKVENAEMYIFNIHHNRLKKTLECNDEQSDFVDYAIDEFENDMMFASTVSDSTSRNKVVRNALEKNLNLMGMVLDKKQYRKYLTLINITLKNRGFEIK